MTQVDTAGDNLTSAALASTGDAIVFGGGGGYVHLWALSGHPRINAQSEVSSIPQPPRRACQYLHLFSGRRCCTDRRLKGICVGAATGAAASNATTGSAAQGA